MPKIKKLQKTIEPRTFKGTIHGKGTRGTHTPAKEMARVRKRRIPAVKPSKALIEIKGRALPHEIVQGIRNGVPARKMRDLIKKLRGYSAFEEAQRRGYVYASWPLTGTPRVVFTKKKPVGLAFRGRTIKI